MSRFQHGLPRLPVPALEETCALYLRLVQPLLTETELTATRNAVSDFARSGGPGGVLQERLVRWSETGAPDNWLEPFWDDHYLCDDAPLVVNVSPGFVLSGRARPQIERAAGLLSAAVRFKGIVDREELEPDLSTDASRCMSEYPRVLAHTRIPGTTRDRIERYPDSRHAVVVHDHALFSLDLVDEEGRPYAAAVLERALEQITGEAGSPGVPVGVLTTGGRREWAKVRQDVLRQGPRPSRAALEAVESAIIVLVLERDASPHLPLSGDAARLMLHGDARGRWFDKSIQLVVAADGVAGFCMEHAGFDGSTALRFAEFLVEHESAQRNRATARRDRDLMARRLPVESTGPLLEAIVRSERRVDALVGRTDLAVLDFRDFGKSVIVEHALSPDGFVQMAFQLAYFTLTGGVASTYESVDTKRFLHGRTEAMRSVSPESVAFVSSLRASPRRGASTAKLLRTAIARHSATVRRCQEGRGVDRHLLGLRRMLEPKEPVPALFVDRGYSTLSRSVLSTSALPWSDGVELTCFGPVVEEGFGISYAIGAGSIRCVVTNFDGLAEAFAEQLERAMREMRSELSDLPA